MTHSWKNGSLSGILEMKIMWEKCIFQWGNMGLGPNYVEATYYIRGGIKD